jgi:hypothetical protein
MKNFYHWCFKTACVIGTFITGMNAVTAQTVPDYSNANYTAQNVGKIIPNDDTYADKRQKTRFSYDVINKEDRLPERVVMTDLSVTPGNGGVELRWRTNREPDNLKLYEIEYSKDGITFQQAGVVPAGNYLNGRAYAFRHFPVNGRDRLFYRVRIVDKNGRYDYSSIFPVTASGTTANYVFPTIVNADNVSLYLNDSFRLVQIVNMQGRILQTLSLQGRTGRVDIPLSNSAEGICFVRVMGENPQRNIVQKIFIQ